MSGHAGVLLHDGEAAKELELLAHIGGSLDQRGLKPARTRTVGPVAMIYRDSQISSLNTSEETQPLVSPNGSMITWEGRLDNRDDLVLELSTVSGTLNSDAKIVGAAFERWGSECFGKLIGDWAAAVWSAKTQILYLSRDYAGTYPLYFSTVVKGLLLWSSELEELEELSAKLSGGSLRIDDEWIVQYLTLCPVGNKTPFLDIQAVPPGYVLTVRGAKIASARHWSPDPELSIRYKTDHEYEENFRTLFYDAVHCRLRNQERVWAHLSGGLDSTAIVCMADYVCSTEVGTIPRVGTVSEIYLESPESDERRFIKTVEVKRGQAGHHFDEIDYPLLNMPFYKRRPGQPEFIDCFGERQKAIYDFVENSGGSSVLCGDGGDELLGNLGDGISNLMDDLHYREWQKFRGDLQSWSQSCKTSELRLLLHLVRAILPVSVQRLFPATMNVEKRTRLLHPRFKGDARRQAEGISESSFGSRIPSAIVRERALLSVIERSARTPFRRMGRTHLTYPYLHRPLVSFLLAIPMDQLTRPGERRSLMRRSLRSLLPDEILRRRGKQSPSSALHRAFIRRSNVLLGMFNDALSVSLGFIDGPSFVKAAKEAQHGMFPVSIIATALSLEAWLQKSKPIFRNI